MASFSLITYLAINIKRPHDIFAMGPCEANRLTFIDGPSRCQVQRYQIESMLADLRVSIASNRVALPNRTYRYPRQEQHPPRMLER